MRTPSKWLISATFVGLALAAAFAFRAEIGTAVFARAAASRVPADVVATLPDGLHIFLCGTGSPMPDRDRAGPCTAIFAGQRLFVIDAGEGSARTLVQSGIAPGRIEALLLTHFHSDHIDGLAPLALMRWTGGPARTPLTVLGPAGVEGIVAGFNAAYAPDRGYRVAHHGPEVVPPSGGGLVARPFALGPDGTSTVLANGGLRITAFRVAHAPVEPAVGYRFDYRGRSVVVSGDTAPSPAVERAAKRTDLLVHEALQPRLVAALGGALQAAGQPNTAKIMADIPDYHTTPEQAADVAQRAGVRQLVLTHIVPPLPSRLLYPAFLGGAPGRFDGRMVVGEDGMLFSLPAGSQEIEERRLP
jgi:ribonuclease Z